MIDLSRRNGRPLVIGHRGAAAIAPENTLEAFRTAAELGVDLVEFDVLALENGPLVVAHSDRLEVPSRGESGSARSQSCASWRRRCRPSTRRSRGSPSRRASACTSI
jgi:glycerophosphoryl diester phosphodiesterase